MIVQAGAARKVLGDIPDDARDALLAVEATGRAAMTELRHLLGLLSPAPPAADDPPDWRRGGDDLQPQPGLEQVHSLVAGVWATGLPVQLFAEAMPPDVPAGVSLTAFRIVQEGLTNVMKHAGTPSTKVTVSCLDKSVLVEVADDGDPAAGGTTATPTIGRGLFGLHERVALYGGELDYGPRPGGGWSLRARIPTRRLAAPARDDRPSPGRPAPRG
jgi:signal transduction histidine kinase